jgi:hypothetical protein
MDSIKKYYYHEQFNGIYMMQNQGTATSSPFILLDISCSKLAAYGQPSAKEINYVNTLFRIMQAGISSMKPNPPFSSLFLITLIWVIASLCFNKPFPAENHVV